MLYVDVGQQISDEVVLLMQVRVLKAGYLQQELIEPDEVTHHCNDVFLLGKGVFLFPAFAIVT